MPAWAIPLVSALSGVVATFLLSIGRDVAKERRERRSRKAFVRRLLAHHAAMLVEDADTFLAAAQQCSGLPDREIALRFRDATTHEHGYREQIGQHLADLTDELIDLLRDLDAATAEAATAVAILQRRASEILKPRVLTPGSSIAHTIGVDGLLANDADNAVRVFRRLREVSITVLCRLELERSEIPARARRAIPGLLQTPQLSASSTTVSTVSSPAAIEQRGAGERTPDEQG